MTDVAEVHIALRDGSTARVRPVVPADAHALRAFLAALSDDSRRLRYFSLGVDLDGAAESAAAGDRPRGYGLIVTTGAEERVVAHAVYELERRDRAEVAFAVADEMQGRGLATVLIAHLAQVASARGIRTFTATVLPENRRMINVFRDSGFPVHLHASPDGIGLEFPTELGEAARRRFDDRDRVAAVAAMERILRPRSVAVIGASRRQGSFGGTVFRHLLDNGFRGELYPVNPNTDYVGSRRASPTVRDTPGPVDLAIIAVPVETVPDVARGCAEAGVAALIVITAGFGEAGAAGAARLAELLDACRASGMRLLGPNCMGVVNTDPEVSLTATFARADVPAGTVGFVSQSGAFAAAAIDGMSRRGIGPSAFVSLGDKVDLSSNDALQYFEQDPATRVVALYLESFGNPRKFGRVARRVARIKPVLAVKAGRAPAGAAAASSHTRALIAASERTVDALFASAGVIRCDGLDDLLDAAVVLAEQPAPRAGGVAIVANAHGPGIVCADSCGDAGLEVASLSPGTRTALRARLAAESIVAGPVQLVAGVAPESFAAAVELAAADPGVGAVIAIFVEHIATDTEVARALVAAAPRLDEAGTPLLAVFMTPGAIPDVLRHGAVRVPTFSAPEAAARALGRATAYARWRAAPPAEAPTLDGLDSDAATAVLAGSLARGGGWLEPDEVEALLGAYGLALLEQRRVGSVAEAAKAAAELGGPVALKAVAPGVIDKTRAGGVRLGLAGPIAVRRAAGEIARRLQDDGTPAAGFIVQRMVAAGIEMLVGVVADERFGPAVACGAGGAAAELLGDVQVRLAPLAREDALGMIRGLRSFALLEDTEADIGALVDIAVRMGALAAAHPSIAELDLNPVMALPGGAPIVDARIRVVPPAAQPIFPAVGR